MHRVLLALVVLVAPAAARSWKVSYFFDDARETLRFTDIAVPSATRGIAVGTIIDEVGEHSPKHVAVITVDGGDTWTQVKLSDAPRSLFFLNDSIGWMVTDRGISKTDESGRTWRRIYKNSNLLTVWFLDENHGFAAGVEKTFIETRDGGVTWKPVTVVKSGPGRENRHRVHADRICERKSRVGGWHRVWAVPRHHHRTRNSGRWSHLGRIVGCPARPHFRSETKWPDRVCSVRVRPHC